jgi:hypothetical protein
MSAPPWGRHALPAGPRYPVRPLALSHLGISPTNIGHNAGIPVVRNRNIPVGNVTALYEPRDVIDGPRPGDLIVGVRRRPYVRTLVVGDAPRFADPHTERVYREAMLDAIETVRAGLAHLVERDEAVERIEDLYRPSRPLPEEHTA